MDAAKPCCKKELDDPWIVKNWDAKEQATCDNSRFGNSLTYARFASPADAQDWATQELTQGTRCESGETARMLQLHSPAAKVGCLTIPDGNDKGVHLWWVDKGSTVAGYYSPGTLDQHDAVTAWELVANAP
jgi:hypothetical protein